MMASTAVGARAEQIGQAGLARLTETIGHIGRRLAPIDARKSDAAALLTDELGDIGVWKKTADPAPRHRPGTGDTAHDPGGFHAGAAASPDGGRFAPDTQKAVADKDADCPLRSRRLDRARRARKAHRENNIRERSNVVAKPMSPIGRSSSGRDAALVLEPGQTLELSTREGAFILNSGLLTINQGGSGLHTGYQCSNARLSSFPRHRHDRRDPGAEGPVRQSWLR